MLVGNANLNLFIYFPPQRTITGLWNQQYKSATNARQYASCCCFWNAVSYHLSQLCNLAENPPGNIKIQLLKHFYFWKLFMSFYIFLAYIKFLGSSGLAVHLMDDWGGAFFPQNAGTERLQMQLFDKITVGFCTMLSKLVEIFQGAKDSLLPNLHLSWEIFCLY